MFRGAVDRVGLEADLPAGLHLINLREDDVIAVADFFLVKGHGNIAVGVRLQGGDGLYRPVRVIGGDMVHEIRICFSLRQGSAGRDGFQPDEPQGFVQPRQHDLAVLHDRPVLDHDMPQRLRFAVGKRKAPRVRVGLIDLHVADIALLRALGNLPCVVGSVVRRKRSGSSASGCVSPGASPLGMASRCTVLSRSASSVPPASAVNCRPGKRRCSASL